MLKRPKKKVGLPRGCACVDDKQTAAECTVFECHETCDLTIGQCDPYCCVDPDCTATEIANFKADDACIGTGKTYKLNKCSAASDLVDVNAKYRMFVETDDDPLGGLLCVQVDNNPIKGDFYESTVKLVGQTSLFEDPDLIPSTSFNLPAASSRSSTLAAQYLTGDPLPVMQSDGNTFSGVEKVFGGYLSLPTGGVGGTCNAMNFAQFALDVDSNACVRPLSNLASECTSPTFSIAFYAKHLWVGKSPNADPASEDTWEQATVRKIYVRDLPTGQDTDCSIPAATAAPTAATNEPTSTPTAAPTTNATNGTRRMLAGGNCGGLTRDTETTFEANTCKNAVVGVTYIVTHNPAGVVESVQTDLYVAAAVNAASKGITQTFNIEFVNSNATSSDTTRVVSGNPGYLFGLPVLSGKLEQDTSSTKSAIAMSENGLQAFSAAGKIGSCVTGNGDWWDSVDSAAESSREIPVLFGSDLATSCTVEMKYDDFKNSDKLNEWCNANMLGMKLFNLNSTVGAYVGLYGNSDPNKVWEWTKVAEVAPTDTKPSPVIGALACQDVVDQLQLEIMWTNTGEVLNPQPMILAARATYGQSDWAWRGASSPADATQTFTFSQTVTFIEYDKKGQRMYKPDRPPLLPAIPSDVFYPFDISSDAIRSVQATSHTATALFAAVATAALLLIPRSI